MFKKFFQKLKNKISLWVKRVFGVPSAPSVDLTRAVSKLRRPKIDLTRTAPKSRKPKVEIVKPKVEIVKPEVDFSFASHAPIEIVKPEVKVVPSGHMVEEFHYPFSRSIDILQKTDKKAIFSIADWLDSHRDDDMGGGRRLSNRWMGENYYDEIAGDLVGDAGNFLKDNEDELSEQTKTKLKEFADYVDRYEHFVSRDSDKYSEMVEEIGQLLLNDIAISEEEALSSDTFNYDVW